MAILEIPVQTDSFHYRFRVRLEGADYGFSFRFNRRMNRWTLSVYDGDDQPILTGIPLILGVDLLARYQDSRLPPGNLFLLNVSSPYEEAGRTDLGTRVLLLYKEAA